MNEEEKKLVDDTKTVGEVHTIQRKIALLREQQGKDNKIGNLNDQVDKLKTQLLDIKKKDLNVRLANFRANLSIQESDLQTKFPHNYQQILNESLTLDNLEQLENTIRAVICICATETISQEVNDDNKKANSDEVQILLTHLNLIKNA